MQRISQSVQATPPDSLHPPIRCSLSSPPVDAAGRATWHLQMCIAEAHIHFTPRRSASARVCATWWASQAAVRSSWPGQRQGPVRRITLPLFVGPDVARHHAHSPVARRRSLSRRGGAVAVWLGSGRFPGRFQAYLVMPRLLNARRMGWGFCTLALNSFLHSQQRPPVMAEQAPAPRYLLLSGLPVLDAGVSSDSPAGRCTRIVSPPSAGHCLIAHCCLQSSGILGRAAGRISSADSDIVGRSAHRHEEIHLTDIEARKISPKPLFRALIIAVFQGPQRVTGNQRSPSA